MIETNRFILCELRVKLCELGGKMDFWDSLCIGQKMEYGKATEINAIFGKYGF